MKRPCEVCSGLSASGLPQMAGGGRMHRVVIEGRIVALCERHRSAAESSGVETLSELREHFVEAPNGRSLIDRRSPLDRRQFPPRPEGRRRSAGRRFSDVV